MSPKKSKSKPEPSSETEADPEIAPVEDASSESAPAFEDPFADADPGEVVSDAVAVTEDSSEEEHVSAVTETALFSEEEQHAPLPPGVTEETLPPTMEEVLDQLEEQVVNVPIVTLDHDKAKKWLQAFREPLAGLGTRSFIDMLQAITEGKSDEHLRHLYSSLTPDELNEVIAANADTINEVADQRAREAAIAKLAHERVTGAMSSIIFQALSKALLLI